MLTRRETEIVNAGISHHDADRPLSEADEQIAYCLKAGHLAAVGPAEGDEEISRHNRVGPDISRGRSVCVC
jgi:hypothetical protein